MFNPHEYLNSFANFELHLQKLSLNDFNLARIKAILDLLGNPDKNLKVIHVAGTKGKGSTCAFLASILQQAGFKVGLYTSPHLHRVNERIRILSQANRESKEDFSGAVSDDHLASVLALLRPSIAAIQNSGGFLTYFEVLTMAALCYFAQEQVDFAILETGLGGRLDATNVADSLVAVLTPVSLDHTQILGSTLAQIAVEKAGIIKNTRQKVVVAPQDKEAMDTIANRCKEFGIEPTMVVPEHYKDLKTSLKGAHQTVNAAVALQAIDVLRKTGIKISDEAVHGGLKHVRWPGRFEVLQENPTVVVDCAHNAASAKALAQALLDVYPYRRVVLVLGVSSDKDVAAICAHLKDSAAHIILTKARHPRAHQFSEDEARNYFKGKTWSMACDVPGALGEALKSATASDVAVVTGSTFIVAQAIECLCTNTKV